MEELRRELNNLSYLARKLYFPKYEGSTRRKLILADAQKLLRSLESWETQYLPLYHESLIQRGLVEGSTSIYIGQTKAFLRNLITYYDPEQKQNSDLDQQEVNNLAQKIEGNLRDLTNVVIKDIEDNQDDRNYQN